MRNTLYDGYQGPRMSRELLLRRVENAMANELTPKQRYAIIEYYISGKTLVQIARETGVNKSTVWRTLKRGEDRLHRLLKY